MQSYTELHPLVPSHLKRTGPEHETNQVQPVRERQLEIISEIICWNK